jgi:hypothetical protein
VTAPPRWTHLAFWGLVLVILTARILAVFTENVNWDEFALFIAPLPPPGRVTSCSEAGPVWAR